MLEVCDLVEVALLERLERRVLVERQAAITMASQGAEVDIPDLDDAREQFLAALNAPLRGVVPVDPDREDLLVALGLR